MKILNSYEEITRNIIEWAFLEWSPIIIACTGSIVLFALFALLFLIMISFGVAAMEFIRISCEKLWFDLFMPIIGNIISIFSIPGKIIKKTGLKKLLSWIKNQFLAIEKERKKRHQERRNKNGKVNQEEEVFKSPFEILGVSPNDSPERIKSSYRELVQLYHPDKFQSYSQDFQILASKHFKEIQEAYEALEKAI